MNIFYNYIFNFKILCRRVMAAILTADHAFYLHLIGSKYKSYTVIGGSDLRDGINKAVHIFVKI